LRSANTFGVTIVEKRLEMKGYVYLLGIFAEKKSDMGGLAERVSWI